jgi:hypothetical protein
MPVDSSYTACCAIRAHTEMGAIVVMDITLIINYNRFRVLHPDSGDAPVTAIDGRGIHLEEPHVLRRSDIVREGL